MKHLVLSIFALCMFVVPVPAQHHGHGAKEIAKPLMSIPDVEVLDQDGRKVRFYSDLVKGKVVAINFIFTSCTTICPPMGATFAQVQKELAVRPGSNANFISVSVDPVTDTPERLKAWREKFKAGSEWTLVTGEKTKMDELLRALAAATARPSDHSPIIIIGNDAQAQWTRTYGLAKPSQIIQLIDQVTKQSPASEAQNKPPTPANAHSDHPPASGEQPTPAAKYFTDVELLDQDGRKVKFYSDVLKGKTVVINALFTTCTNVCPPISRNFERIQEALGPRLGEDVFLVSITVDPETDTPAKLKEYAQRFHARKGWSFLTGNKENINQALYKLGQYVDEKTQHKTVIIIGNEATGLWKKAFGLAAAADLIKLVEEVMNDKGDAATSK